jgi:hypothetical protein
MPHKFYYGEIADLRFVERTIRARERYPIILRADAVPGAHAAGPFVDIDGDISHDGVVFLVIDLRWYFWSESIWVLSDLRGQTQMSL